MQLELLCPFDDLIVPIPLFLGRINRFHPRQYHFGLPLLRLVSKVVEYTQRYVELLELLDTRLVNRLMLRRPG